MGRRRKPKKQWAAVNLAELGVVQGKHREQALRDEEQRCISELVAGLADPEEPVFGVAEHRAPKDMKRRKLAASIATQSLKRCFNATFDAAYDLVLKAIDTEHAYYLADLEHDLCRAVHSAYDRVCVDDIYEELADNGLVTEKPAPYCFGYNCIVYPRAAEQAVDAFWDAVVAAMWKDAADANRGVIETLNAVLAQCKASPIVNVDGDIEQCERFSGGKLLSVFADPQRRTDANVPLVSAYGPVHVESVDKTALMVVKRVWLPRSIAVDTLRKFTALIQPYVAKHNARRHACFDIARAESVFHMSARAVPHVLGARHRAVSNVAKLIAGINNYKAPEAKVVCRRDAHIAILRNNCQCTAALYINATLNIEQRAHAQQFIAECAKNRFEEQSYWSDS